MTLQPNPGSTFPTPSMPPSLENINSAIASKYIENKAKDALYYLSGGGTTAKIADQLQQAKDSATQITASGQAITERQTTDATSLEKIESPLPKVPDPLATKSPV